MFRLTILLVISLAFLTGCYQISSEDSLHTVPTTNNPNLIPESSKTVQMHNLGL